MDKKVAKRRIEKLKKVIRRHRYLYHVLDKQEISPEALDSLKHELYKLEQEHPGLITSDSPTQRIAGKPLSKFKKAKHAVPMLSIEDIFSEEELQDWEDYLKRLTSVENINYFCELKIDGFGISLIYEDGVFLRGATRGNGKVGENVTQNLKTIDSIPLRVNFHDHLEPGFKRIENNLKKLINKGKIEIRGEVYMRKDDFDKINMRREEQGEKTYANPRNLAAGSIRQLDSKLAASRSLKFLAYDLITETGQSKHSQEHQMLSKLGFKVDQGRKCKDLKEVVDFWKDVAKDRDTLPFQVDGIVVNLDNNATFEELGVAGKSPRGARALKFSPQQATTRILDIKVQIGRTGAVTPIAFLKPVKIGGATISRATLHNEDQIKRLGVRIDDTVIVERAGDVIPAVVKVLSELRTGKEKKFKMPRSCPICGTKLVKPAQETVWRCPSSNCSARKKELLCHFVSRKAFDISGMGAEIINQLVDENLISQPADIFNLTKGDLIPLERFAEKSAENIILAIQNSKKITLSRFISSLGIRHVGEETAISLAQYFGNINKLKDVSRVELESIPDIGSEVSKSIFKWFHSEEKLKLVNDLLEIGVEILTPEKFGNKLKDKKFILTGSLKSMSRSDAEKNIRVMGGNPVKSISRNTDFLIAGEYPGSKFEKAKKLGIKIIKEKEFLNMINK